MGGVGGGDNGWRLVPQEENYVVIEQCDQHDIICKMLFFAELEMASIAVVTPECIQIQSNGLHLVNWINQLLKIDFKDVQQFGSGGL